MITVLKPCERELNSFPLEVREDLADALARLEAGLSLSMPLSRPMPSIGKNVHELRLRDRHGTYRIVYGLFPPGKIVVIHAFKKKSRQLPLPALRLAKRRIKEWLG